MQIELNDLDKVRAARIIPLISSLFNEWSKVDSTEFKKTYPGLTRILNIMWDADQDAMAAFEAELDGG